jgi:protein-L-isoaspartate(D-aspartate) O-methyltransferase
VEHLLRRGFVHDGRIAEAFLSVPREVFLPETRDREGLAAVYRDDAIVTRRDPSSQAPLSSSSQPAIMALMLEMLDVWPGQRVLEVGAGTGYNAALLDVLVGDQGFVVTVDIDREIAVIAGRALGEVGARSHVVVADGAHGLPGAARQPMDRIEVTASSASVPRAWYDQLAMGGRVVVPLRLSDQVDKAHAVTGLVKVAEGFDSVAVTPGGFMPLRRADGSPFYIESPGTPSSPFAEVSREEMARLAVSVRYGNERPDSRWCFDRGDHWIGVDVDQQV